MKKELMLKVILVFCVVGIITSIYLTNNHYAHAEGGSICDVGESVSCSIVNTSVYSELFNVPVAIFGMLWFIILGLMSWKALKRDDLIPAIFGWSVLGFIFILYMIYAEYVLQSICLFCTLLHILIAVTLVFSWLMYRGKKWSKVSVRKAVQGIIVLAIILNLLALLFFNVGGEKEDHTEVAKCITANGVDMYGSFRCGVCARERAMFGDAFKYINEIECHPQGPHAQTEKCLEKKVEGTPTWIMEEDGQEVKRQVGFMTIDDLKAFAGCTDEVLNAS
tara:strand:+ start:5789 stop:6622 length:834 start_codon:yes stop_codon:yes gene_type:complete